MSYSKLYNTLLKQTKKYYHIDFSNPKNTYELGVKKGLDLCKIIFENQKFKPTLFWELSCKSNLIGQYQSYKRMKAAQRHYLRGVADALQDMEEHLLMYMLKGDQIDVDDWCTIPILDLNLELNDSPIYTPNDQQYKKGEKK